MNMLVPGVVQYSAEKQDKAIDPRHKATPLSMLTVHNPTVLMTVGPSDTAAVARSRAYREVEQRA